ncbi:SphA family protein [Microbulbifer celer]|uniref:Transporter n=1 Tax=Microbulbifer celer TaxID=435905 RepID=A0ABW3UB74_9GAMM|nr:transporter [Microbulbifer celer]UFN59125.1 transporter [Microbulbifer celer]
MQRNAVVHLFLLLLLLPTRAFATEGALGRAATGAQGTFYAGLVPPEPGFSFQLTYLGYSGSIRGQREVPIAGELAVGLDATLNIMSLTGSYVWDTGPGKWNFASMVTVPFIHVTARAEATLAPFTTSNSDRQSGLFDVYFAPVIAGRHFSETRHLSLSLYLYAPTGDYDVRRLANPGLNTWTFSPTAGYTQLMQNGTLEWSSLAAVDFYTENKKTNIHNGAVFRLDSVLVKRCNNGFGYGLAGGWIRQIEDDTGPLVDRLGGFRGRALSLGPLVTYSWSWLDKKQATVSARWMREFEVKRRLEGNPFMLTFSLQF